MLKSKISGKWFNGVFDGGFHKITGLYIDTVSDIHSNESIWNSNAALFQTSNYGIIKNLYLEGEISSPKGCAGLVYWLGNITARNSMAGGSIWNSYYREDCIDESNEYGEPKSADFMRTQEFVDLLNSGNETDVWTMDAENTNDGYPIIGDTHFGVSENFFTNTDLVIVYPNPVTDYINIVGDVASYEIYDVVGKCVRRDARPCVSTVSASDFQSGIYIMKFVMRNGSVVTKKIVKK